MSETKKIWTLTLNLFSSLEELDKALPAMKNPEDIFFLDLDNNGEWKVVNENQLQKL